MHLRLFHDYSKGGGGGFHRGVPKNEGTAAIFKFQVLRWDDDDDHHHDHGDDGDCDSNRAVTKLSTL